jgi:protein-S-isoprenylcysteine O-methyltransferase Ste14
MTARGWDEVARVATTAAWALFATVWAAGAIYNARRAPTATRRAGGRAGWIVVAVAVWLVIRVTPDRTWDALTLEAGWVRAVGLALLAPATAFTIWARVILGRMWSSVAQLRRDHELRTDGPYAITRHPIYTGMLGMLIGTALLSGGGRWIVVIPAAVAYVVAKIRAEEGLLSALFPGDYERYRNAVPMLIPRPGRRIP